MATFTTQRLELYYMTGVFPQRSLVDSWSRGMQYVLILQSVQYLAILTRGTIMRAWSNLERLSIRSYETQWMLF